MIEDTLKKIGIEGGTIDDWLWLNLNGIKENPELRKYVAPFPPKELMSIVSGLTDELDFASHGVDIYKALIQASPVPWSTFKNVLDLACGCGRVARMFKDHDLDYHGVDIDSKHINWIKTNLPFVKAKLIKIGSRLPYPENTFDCIFSISLLTHVTEVYQDFLFNEIIRIAKPNSYIFLTTHGQRAFERACQEEQVYKLINVDDQLFEQAKMKFKENKHAFILQKGHLTNKKYQYGIAFTPESYIRSHWSQWFKIIEVRHGAIHDFQDIIVLRTK